MDPKNCSSGANSGRKLNIVVEGCCHGELDSIYASIQLLEEHKKTKVDLLICCGDFQSIRNMDDFEAVAIPAKYRKLMTFYKYYSGECVAPVPTVFIGGNHEASNYLQDLFYGGWVAPNIYYLGRAGSIIFGGLRLSGLSGIYNGRHYRLGHYEKPPYDQNALRSVYHVREMETYKLSQLRGPVDIFLSHDWPSGIAHHGNKEELLRKKSFLRREVDDGSLGSPAAKLLLDTLKPRFWFSAHLHVKFAAVVKHPDENDSIPKDTPVDKEDEDASKRTPPAPTKMTRFLSLDKCLPNRDFLQLLSIDCPDGEVEDDPVLEYDIEWLAILRKTAYLTSTSQGRTTVPQYPMQVNTTEKLWVAQRLRSALGLQGEHGQDTSALEQRANGNPGKEAQGGKRLRFPIPVEHFILTVPADGQPDPKRLREQGRERPLGNPQTDWLLTQLEIPHTVTVAYMGSIDQDKNIDEKNPLEISRDENEIDIESSDSDDNTATAGNTNQDEVVESNGKEGGCGVSFVIDRTGTEGRKQIEELGDVQFVIDRKGTT